VDLKRPYHCHNKAPHHNGRGSAVNRTLDGSTYPG
jgi:hypothetical protein